MTASFATVAARRYGYGLRPGETPPGDIEALMRQLERGAATRLAFPREGVTGRRETAARLVAVRTVEAKAAEQGRPNTALRQDSEREAERIFVRDALARLLQAVQSENGFHERLASFWIDHFQIDARVSYETNLLMGSYEVEVIRPNLGGYFRDLLTAAALHPAMLIAFDQTRSASPQSQAGALPGAELRDQLARHILVEQTTGGIGVSEEDVRGAALILAGVGVDPATLAYAYVPAQADRVAQTVLGKVYGAQGRKPDDCRTMLEDLAERPETVDHLCRKLAAHFVGGQRAGEVADAMKAAWTASGGRLATVYRAMLEHPVAFSPEPQVLQRPFDMVVSALRAFGLSARQLNDIAMQASGVAIESSAEPEPTVGTRLASGVAAQLTLEGLRRMGQPIWQPPMLAGDPAEEAAWLTGPLLQERIAWARLATRVLPIPPDPERLMQAVLADAVHDDLARLVREAPSRSQAMTMILASPAFNRR
ncbi:DUF1800 family protein [Affinirhizobium pseudoryzae]|jgi:uncharacterized protein (DUF1800 family)|uniref:DUF1800 family protein n=1 Tax=Allorhizobium pseudoryzae TaxID=379684 RepID=UPI0013E9E14A|nr:DUF1800 family protein [Allorhizobium pseudoryzae]